MFIVVQWYLHLGHGFDSTKIIDKNFHSFKYCMLYCIQTSMLDVIKNNHDQRLWNRGDQVDSIMVLTT